MRRITLALLILASTAAPVCASAPADASSSSAVPTAGAPAASAAPTKPTPSLAERLAQLEDARTKLIAQCQTGIAQHDGAIAVLRAAIGDAPATP